MTAPRALPVLLLALLVVTGGLAWWWGPAGADLPPPGVRGVSASGRGPDAAAKGPDAVAIDDPRGGGRPAADTPREPSPGARAAAATARGETVLRGRTLDAVTGRAIAGAEVSIRGWPGSDARVAAVGRPPRWRDPLPVVTADDGRFELRVRPEPAFGYDVLVAKDGYRPVGGKFTDLAPGTELDFGELPLHVGVRCSGVVVDEGGTPRGGVVFACSTSTQRLPRSFVELARPRTWTTDGTGRFTDSEWVDAASWLTYRIETPGYRAVGGARFEVSPEPRTIVLRTPTARLSGRVVDRRGRGVGQVALWLRPASRTVHGQRAVSADDGTFAFHSFLAASARADELVFGVSNRRPLDVDAAAGVACRWGDSTLRIVVERPGAVALTVLDARGEPLTRYSVQVRIAPDAVPARVSPTIGGQHPGGRSELVDVPVGEHVLVVFPRGDRDRPSAPVAFEVRDGERTDLEVRIAPAVELPVLVVDANDEPVVGVDVDFWFPPASSGDAAAWSTRGRGGVARATTGPSGRCMLRVPRDVVDAELRVTGDGVVLPHRERGVSTELPIDERRIVVSRGASLELELRPIDVVQALGGGAGGGGGLRVVLREVPPPGVRKTWQWGHVARLEVDAAGRAVADGLEPGPLEVWLDWPIAAAAAATGVPGQRDRSGGPLAVLDLVDGVNRRTVDARAAQTARVSGRARIDRVDDAVLRSLVFQRAPAGGAAGVSISVPVAADGAFDATRLTAGRYAVEALIVASGKQHRLPVHERLDLAPGEHRRLDETIRTVRLRLRLLARDGTPIAGVGTMVMRSVTGAPGKFGGASSETTDRDGWLTVEFAGPGTYRVIALGHGDVGPIDVSVGAGGTIERTLRLP